MAVKYVIGYNLIMISPTIVETDQETDSNILDDSLEPRTEF